MRELPTGTVTFLFTDIEGSTRLLQELGPEEYESALTAHRGVLREACAANAGAEMGTEGDGFFAAFPTAPGALAAAAKLTAALAEGPIRVRVGVHTGTPLLADEGYVGIDVHRVARIMSAGHGGQVLVSETTQKLVGQEIELHDLGPHRLKGMTEAQRLYQLGDGDFPPLWSLNRTNLPVQPTPLVGRKGELADLAELLAGGDLRLLTLTGAGGTGKTRLALELARQLRADFLDGVFLVEVATISDPMLLAPTIAGALGLVEEAVQSFQHSLAQALRERELLLVLDNLEQLPGAAPIVAELQRACPRLVVLVTSRSPLHLMGERRYPVGPLPASDAFELLVARARAANPSFAPTEESRVSLEAICARLDGLPLALELAAARLKLLSPEALLRRLERSLELLVGGAGDLPERQRTMRSTIAWSDGLLSAAERRFFHRLAVFSGGCTLEAAEAVGNPGGELGDTLTLAEKLLDASLVHAQAATDGEQRLQLLQTIREYAAEALAADAEEELARSRHGEHFLALAERAEPELSGSEQMLWMARIEQEQDNFREALALAAQTGQISRELRLVGSLGFFWSIRGRHLAEGRRRLDEALSRAESSSAELRAKALRQNAWIAIRQGQLDDARSLAEEAAEIYRSLGDAGGTHNTLDALAAVLIETGERAKAGLVLEESLALARTLGNENFIAATLNNLALLALLDEEYERAREVATESLESFTELGSSYGSAIAQYHIGAALAQQGAFGEALPHLRESLRLSDELGDDEGVICCLEAIALLTAEGGEAASAAELLGCTEARAKEIGVKRAQFEQLVYDNAVNAVRERVADDEFTRCWAAGESMTIDDAVASVQQADTRPGDAAAGRVPAVD